MAARRDNPAAVTTIPLEFVDDTLSFNPEWVVDRIAPRPVLFITSDNDRLVPPAESEALYARAGEPKKLVMLHGRMLCSGVGCELPLPHDFKQCRVGEIVARAP